MYSEWRLRGHVMGCGGTDAQRRQEWEGSMLGRWRKGGVGRAGGGGGGESQEAEEGRALRSCPLAALPRALGP